MDISIKSIQLSIPAFVTPQHFPLSSSSSSFTKNKCITSSRNTTSNYHLLKCSIQPLPSKTKVSKNTPSTSTNNSPTPISSQNKLFDVVVIGAGPAGLSVSQSLASKSLSVCCIDPKLHDPWPNHYGVWEDEFQQVGLHDCATHRYPTTSVFTGKKKTVLNRPYIRVDRVKLKKKFMDVCIQTGVSFIESYVSNVQHITNQSSLISCQNDLQLHSRLVIDCTGHALQFTSSNSKPDQDFKLPWAQAAYGIEAIVDSYPFDKSEMVLMDFRDDHMRPNPHLAKESEKRPTFLYVFPGGENRAFFEETSVIAPNAVPFEDLKQRLYLRLDQLGIKVTEVIEEERSLIPMGGSLPNTNQRIIGFGGAAGLVHPATGYMVARTLKLADQISSTIADGLKQLGDDGDVTNVSKAAWQCTWNRSVLRQRDFLNFGAELLGELSMKESRAFFQAFFNLPRRFWENFLGYELDSPGERAIFALWFFMIADWEIRIGLLKGIIEIGRWRLVRSVLPEWIGGEE